MLKQNPQQHNKIFRLYILQSRHHTTKLNFSFHKQNYNQQLNQQLFQRIHKWITKHVVQKTKTVHLTKKYISGNSFANHNYDFYTNNSISNPLA